jgi:hypothetical protein
MATRIHYQFLLSGGFALLAGCAAQGDFPSLAPRAVEGDRSPAAACRCNGQAKSAPAAAAAAPVADDPALGQRVTELVGRARTGEREFTEILPAARRSAGRAGRSGSEPWIEAQQLLSRLEAARSSTVDALAELDALSIARSEDAGTSLQDRERLAAAAQQIRELAEAQRAELGRLSAQLSTP